MHIRWLDLLIIALYMVAVAYIGWRCSHRQTSTENYFVPRRSVPHWAMAFSFFATLISSITFIAPEHKEMTLWSWLVKRKTLTEEAPAPEPAPTAIQ